MSAEAAKPRVVVNVTYLNGMRYEEDADGNVRPCPTPEQETASVRAHQSMVKKHVRYFRTIADPDGTLPQWVGGTLAEWEGYARSLRTDARAIIPPRTRRVGQARSRGGGRPRARRTSSRSAGGGDDGSGSTEGGEPPGSTPLTVGGRR